MYRLGSLHNNKIHKRGRTLAWCYKFHEITRVVFDENPGNVIITLASASICFDNYYHNETTSKLEAITLTHSQT